jgi:hypothetical protein
MAWSSSWSELHPANEGWLMNAPSWMLAGIDKAVIILATMTPADGSHRN